MSERMARRATPMCTVFLVWLVLVSCVTTGPKPISEHKDSLDTSAGSHPGALIDLGISASDENLNVTLGQLILPNGIGAWVKDAPWDEYVLTVRNVSDKRLNILSVRLIDPGGKYINSNDDPSGLERESKKLASEYKAAGITMAAAAAPSIVIGVGVTTMSLGAITTAATVAPVAAVGAPIAYMMHRVQKTKNKERIEEEFAKRKLLSSGALTLSGDATITGSVFFPLVPNPKALVIDYKIEEPGASMSIFEMPLDRLAGLHVARPVTIPPPEALTEPGALPPAVPP